MYDSHGHRRSGYHYSTAHNSGVNMLSSKMESIYEFYEFYDQYALVNKNQRDSDKKCRQ
jgi:hypothetical protein